MIRVNPFYLLPEDEIPERLRSLDAHGRVEAALIGRLLLEPSLVPRAIRYGAREELFAVELFRRVWVAVSTLHSKGIPCDMHSIRAELRQVNPNDDTLLVEIACMFQSPGYNASIKHYVRILRFRCGRSLAESVCRLPGESESIEDFAVEVIHTGNEMVQIASSILDDGSDDQRSQWDIMDSEIEQARGGTLGIKSGLSAVDESVGGFRPGEYVIVGARPGVGKSSFAITTVVNTLASDPAARVLYASAEMRSSEILKRLVSARSKVSCSRFERGSVTREERARWEEAAQALRQTNVRVAHKGMNKPEQVRAEALRLREEIGGLDLVVVDHIHAMRHDAKSRQEQITMISNLLLETCHELNAPFLVLAQLSRSVESREDKAPQLHDLRDSGSLEQDADYVLMLHRNMDARPADFVHDASVLVRKARRGEPGAAEVAFLADCTLFVDRTPKAAEVWSP